MSWFDLLFQGKKRLQERIRTSKFYVYRSENITRSLCKEGQVHVFTNKSEKTMETRTYMKWRFRHDVLKIIY